MQRGNLRALTALVTIALSLGAAPAPKDDASQVLRQAMSAPSTVSYVGEVQRLEIGQSQSEASIFRVEHRAPSLSRYWYIAPQSLYGDSIITRGEVSYSIDVKRSRVIVDENDTIDDQVAIDDNFSLLTTNYRAVLAPNETVVGHSARVVLLVNRHTGQTTMRVWIDGQTHLVLQKERYAANGSLTSQMRFEQLRYTGAIPTGVFDVPKDLPQSRGSSHSLPSNDISRAVHDAGFDAKSPRYLPDGFLPVAGDVADVNGVRTLHLLYSDGIRTISLFQNARGAAVDMSRYHPHDIKVEASDAQYVEEGPVTLLAWSESGLHFALVGELSRSELVKIAASVVP
jgi:negative regulator of sigma E activity